MKKLRCAELIEENFVGTSLAGIEKGRVKKATFKALEITPKASLTMLFILGILVCSAAYYLTQSTVIYIENVNVTSVNFVDLATTIFAKTTTTIATTTLVVRTTSTAIYTTITTTTTINEECGGDLQKPCEFWVERKCNAGYVLNAEGMCRIPRCAPSVPNGMSGCGSWALKYCQ